MTALNPPSLYRRITIAASIPAWILLCICAVFVPASTSQAQDSLTEIPEAYRGTWVLRLTSDDAGKTYKSGGNLPICEVTAKEVKFTKKVDYSDEKLVVKSVTKKSLPTPPGDSSGVIYEVTFENGKVWILEQNGANITARLHDLKDKKLTETYRITIRKK